ncbi:winged helix-turn-helix domain-containing protein [Actinosynnema sp. NPDC047251]|uniref:Transcriptional regulator, ArsR family n=1 Tax=Saccharothrix espanaensis (strain ATCC 51144 / DSM 44229 / JCM 9112 / NBRC 15066 / NRRL 15764) TaxID=1179773 RepID=K0JPN7_SACES|nr:winged helix-turn-helix domain-containing protein [Saccharothrix espanaensis]CCH29020.1 Transcriptional regulator, ArsR family [Saccharothrix espanaensis DSM 44229]
MHRRPATEAEAAALSSAVRLRIIRLTYDRALTNKEIAHRLGKDPATTLHHVRKLVATGFLEAQPARTGNRGAREIPYRSTGLSWKLAGGPHPDTGRAMLEAYLAEVAELPPDRLDQTRLVVRVDPAELNRRLRTLLDELEAEPDDPSGERVALYLAVYPGD